ncbi:uncharacterized protein PV09_05874 [Verruconis gallopava]|uniref:Uncharacterized protein n=1 Tax=Verruconis gallopava TaxID=253628 RepID=A0A0D1XKG0_9PEZI|nr:uncharacterized protein PV09_05874 [Verruconis gallopava]KIW02816.1 hypothetical protein PV09_05874 [Verruconis gallopava]
MNNVSFQSDGDIHDFFTRWTDQLIKKQDLLTKQLSSAQVEVDELKTLISIRDEDIEKLQTKVKCLRRKSQNCIQARTLKDEVASLKEQVTDLTERVAIANKIALSHKQNFDEKCAQLSRIRQSKMEERKRFEDRVQELELKIKSLTSRLLSKSPNSFDIPSPRPYISTLSKAIGRNIPESEATSVPNSSNSVHQHNSFCLSLETAARTMVQQGAGLVKGFGDVSLALLKLKEVLDEKNTKQEEL